MSLRNRSGSGNGFKKVPPARPAVHLQPKTRNQHKPLNMYSTHDDALAIFNTIKSELSE